MGKALPVLGIVGAILGALSVSVFSPDSMPPIVPLIALVGAGFLVAEGVGAKKHGGRPMTAFGLAGLVAVLGVLAMLGYSGSVNIQGNELGGGLNQYGPVFAMVAAIEVPIAAMVVRWRRLEPLWSAWVALGCAALAVLIGSLAPEGLVEQNDPITYITTLLAIGTATPMVFLLRGASPARPPHVL